MSSFVLDTHSLLWYLEGNRRLGSRAQAKISAVESHLVVPIIVLAEAGIIIGHGRTKIPSVAYLIDSLAKDHRFEIHPLTLDIFKLSLTSEASRITELHDRLIVATALYIQSLGLDVSLVTRDEDLTNARLVPIVW
ncbi:MAG TPA: PIN domain-containing protein [Promineifilum sp.]|nr:PIN domain-containing protein [Promineifilum sp.]HRO25435.1 PIN domain-containing protein [Promineifilum sp.]HRO89939.1 PIN domain-containing protein [Promineifilum sp.]HRQ12835.1 PIN domain-containing protein [Promineifilum sp.]